MPKKLKLIIPPPVKVAVRKELHKAKASVKKAYNAAPVVKATKSAAASTQKLMDSWFGEEGERKANFNKRFVRKPKTTDKK